LIPLFYRRREKSPQQLLGDNLTVKHREEAVKIRFSLFALVGCAVLFAAPAFAQQKESFDPQIAQQLHANGIKSDDAFNKGDAAGVASVFTEDAVVVTDQGPVYGRQAIEKMYIDLFQKLHFSNHITKVDQNAHHVIGPAVWEVGEWSTTVQGQNFGPIEAKGYFSSINVREGDTWKICMLTFNITPAPAATPSPTGSPSN
jgi:uncharacterized protein (TIGR02246 family)